VESVLRDSEEQRFPASLQRTFDLEGHPMAGIWRYSTLDEQGGFRNAYSHKDRADLVYAVPGHWAIDKGLMPAGPAGFIDETVQPGEELDCMCRFQWLYNLRDMPPDMRTANGDAELERVRQLLASEDASPNAPEQTPGLLRRLLRSFGRWPL
jgi:hypothetical protein